MPPLPHPNPNANITQYELGADIMYKYGKGSSHLLLLINQVYINMLFMSDIYSLFIYYRVVIRVCLLFNEQCSFSELCNTLF